MVVMGGGEWWWVGGSGAILFPPSMISFTRRTIPGVRIVILGALWPYPWKMWSHILFSEYD